MKKILLFIILGLAARAAEVTDLGQGLGYVRVHALSDSTSVIAAATGPLVLDLRYATADGASAAALKTALAGRPVRPSLFLLVSPATPAVLAPVISGSSALTLGLAGSSPAPKVVVQTDAATDRRAYDALETGTPLEKLISGKVEKERFDEATLVKEFKDGNPDAEPPELPDPTATKAAPEKPAPLIDRVLQRAVHLHRALLALKQP